MRRFMRSGTEYVRPLASVLPGLLLFLPALFASGGGVLAAEAGDVYCDSLLQAGAQNRIPNDYLLSPDLGRQVQEGLAAIFADDPAYPAGSNEKVLLHDDRIGPVTRRWLQQFCVDYPIYGTADKVPGAVLESTLHYAQIAQRHPDWKTTITSPEFEAWIQDGSGADQADTRQMRRSGAAPVVGGLLDEFSVSRSETAGTTRTAAGEFCERLLKPGFRTRDARLSPNSRTIGKKIQQGLQAVFAGNPEYDGERDRTDLLFDGIVGRQTRNWMARFCRDFPAAGAPENLPDNVVISLLHYAGIAVVHPDWRDIVTDQDFHQWIVQAVPKGESGNRQLRLSGSAPIVNKLIAQYLRGEESAADVDIPSAECSELTPRGAAVYYQLNEQDWQRLQEREAFVGQVGKLVGKKFDTEEDLNNAIGPTAERLGDRCTKQQFLKALQIGNRNPTSEYRLTRESLDQLLGQLTSPGQTDGEEDFRFVADVIPALEQLQDKGFPNKQRLAQFIRFKAKLAVTGEIAPPANAGSTPQAPEVEDSSPPNSAGAARIEENPEEATSEEATSEEAESEGTRFKGFRFESDKPEEKKPEEEALEEEKPEEEKPEEAAPEEDGAAAAPVVSSAAQPAQQSAEAKVKIDALVKQVVALAERRLWSYEVTDEAVDALKEERLFVPVPESDLVALKPLLDVAYVNAELYATAVRGVLGSGPNIAERVQAIVRQARKIGDSSLPLAVNAADSCGCSRAWDLVGRNHFTVYGFYPSWLPAAVSTTSEPERAFLNRLSKPCRSRSARCRWISVSSAGLAIMRSSLMRRGRLSIAGSGLRSAVPGDSSNWRTSISVRWIW